MIAVGTQMNEEWKPESRWPKSDLQKYNERHPMFSEIKNSKYQKTLFPVNIKEWLNLNLKLNLITINIKLNN